MKAVQPPSWDALARFDAIVAAKRPERRKPLRQLRKKVQRAYRRYRRRRHALGGLTPCRKLRQEHVDLLKHCYIGLTAPLAKLKKDILEFFEASRGSKCPYCGIDNPTTFDHYLPKAVFPEFSVCSDNLIPCCFRCNVARGDRDWRRGRGPAVIHVYYEPIEANMSFVDVSLSVANGAPSVTFAVRPAAANAFSQRLAEHWSALSLKRRFEKEALFEVDELLETAGGLHEDPPDSNLGTWLAEHCQRQARTASGRHGANHWKAAFYSSITASPAFVQFLLAEGAKL